MAITLGSEALSDAEVTDGIGRGDVGAAATLWVRYWSTALVAARRFVEPDEVPGLAAEALIGTIAAITVGRGPREDLRRFVTDAVAELGEGDTPPTAGGAAVPDVFVSPLMTRAFAGLSEEDQEILWLTSTGDQSDQVLAEALDLPLPMAAEARLGALTALQRDYLAEHTEHADDAACQQAHAALAAAVTRTVPLTGTTWVHMSECAWCTEAFHELAFSNVAIDALIDRGAVTPAPVATAPPATAPAAAAATVPVATVTAAATEDAVEPPPAEDAPEPEPVPSGTHAAAFSPLSMLRGRRTRIAGGALLAAAAITAAVLVVTGPDDSDGDLTAARSEQTQDPDAQLPGAFDSVAPPVADEARKPTPSPVPATPTTAPVSTPAARPTPQARPSSTPRPTPAPAPTSTPKPSPKPSPTSAGPSPTPTTPAPTPTPTPTCDPWAQFFGLC